MARNTQAIAKVEEKPLPMVSDVKPSYLVEMEQGGKLDRQDNFGQEDVVVPRVKLLQGLSKECEAFNEAKSGLFWHTGMDISLGDSFNFVVCSRRKRYLLVASIEDGQGILARADDFTTWDCTGKWQVKVKDVKEKVTWEIKDRDVKKSGLDQWGTFNPEDEKSPPAATLFYDYLVYLPDHLDLGPAVISLTRSQIKKAKKGLNDKIELHRAARRPMQAVVFNAKSVSDRNDNNQDFKNWQFTGNGFAAEDLFKMATELKDSMSNYAVQGEEDAASEETAQAGRARGDSSSHEDSEI